MSMIEIKTGSSIVLPIEFLKDIQKELNELGFPHWIKNDSILKVSQGYIGEIYGNDCKILINPSIPYLTTKDYLRLVIYETNLLYDGKDLEFMRSGNLSDYIIDLFLDHMHKLIKEGIPYKYTNKVEFNNFFTGSVDIEETYMRHALNIEPIVKTVSQELTINYFTTGVLWQAYQKILQGFKNKKSPYIECAFYRINKKKYSNNEINSKKIFFHKSEVRLANAYVLAKLIINNMDMSYGEKGLSSSMVIDSNFVFEKFIFKLFREFLPNEPFFYHEKQMAVAFSEGIEKVRIKPDILHKGIKTTVIDVKNKNFENNYANSDFYQIYTYCKAYNSSLGILVYPSNEDTKKLKILTSFDSNITLYAVSINIKHIRTMDRTSSYNKFIKCIMEIINFQ